MPENLSYSLNVVDHVSRPRTATGELLFPNTCLQFFPTNKRIQLNLAIGHLLTTAAHLNTGLNSSDYYQNKIIIIIIIIIVHTTNVLCM
jgi:hypothetical protein